ncbi:hypothetical protein ACWGB8_07965 [Kitasatospora sp. NPDC054939]
MTPFDRTTAITLLRAGLTDFAISRALSVGRQQVRALRTDLGIPQPQRPAPPITPELEAAFRLHTEAGPDGHLIWTGRRRRTTPAFSVGSTHYSARRIAYQLHHDGAAPVGHARPGCGDATCVAPAHQVDTMTTPSDGPVRPEYDSPEAKVAALARPTDDGHLVWTGSTHRGAPRLCHGREIYSPGRLAFRVHYGREPEGHVTVACDRPHCLLGGHLDDARTRASHRAAYAALGL